MRAKAYRTKGYVYRPGWHALLKPEAPHLKTKSKNEKRVWARVALAEYKICERPISQGGKWYLAQKMMVLEILKIKKYLQLRLSESRQGYLGRW